MDTHSLRSSIGLVGQEPVLFDMSVELNIELGREGEVTHSEVVTAAKKANIHDFIQNNLPDGYKTNVGKLKK